MFGDIALINSGPRTASILVLETSEFIIMHKKDFDKFKKFHNKEAIEKREFLVEYLPFLKEVTGEAFIIGFVNNFESMKFLRGHRLIKEGEPADYLFIVKEGHLLLEKEVTSEALNRNRPHHKPEYPVPPMRNVGICDLTEGCVLGEESLCGIPSSFSVTVKSIRCLILGVNKQLFKEFPRVMLEMIKDKFEEKNENRMKMFESALKRVRGEASSSIKGVSVRVPSIVDSIKKKLTDHISEKLLAFEKTKNDKEVMFDQCSELLLSKETDYRDKLKSFYGKYTRKMDHYILPSSEFFIKQ